MGCVLYNPCIQRETADTASAIAEISAAHMDNRAFGYAHGVGQLPTVLPRGLQDLEVVVRLDVAEPQGRGADPERRLRDGGHPTRGTHRALRGRRGPRGLIVARQA